MRSVVQRVRAAGVEVAGEAVARIGPGLLALVGVAAGDTRKGRRPGFGQAAAPALAAPLIEHLAATARQLGVGVAV